LRRGLVTPRARRSIEKRSIACSSRWLARPARGPAAAGFGGGAGGGGRGPWDRGSEPVARAHGAELVDVEFRAERGGWVLRVYVEKAGAATQGLSTRDAAVNLELCADVSRALSAALDAVDLI